jgi:Domain of unknown function (DUF4294)
MHWLFRILFYKRSILLLVVMITAKANILHAQTGIHDTLTSFAVVYDGDTIEAKTLSIVDLYASLSNGNMANRAKWTRLRNAIIVTFPYANKSGTILNEMNDRLTSIKDKSERKAYIKSREKELKKEFTDPLTKLSVYQGKVLMKLINRETGNNCYEIIKEYRGGFTARFYQTVAFFFSSSLKQPYEAAGEDREMEMIVKEVCRTYGYNYAVNRPM